jgi:hypothetical protein
MVVETRFFPLTKRFPVADPCRLRFPVEPQFPVVEPVEIRALSACDFDKLNHRGYLS